MNTPFDPFGIVSATYGAVRTVADALAAGWASAAPPEESNTEKPAPRPPAQRPTQKANDSGLETKMQSLLARALEQSTASGTEELFHRILDQIVPDEARMIGALSDGTVSPMVSVHALTRAGLLGEALLENASLIGRTANVALPQLTPTYVGHLMALGLVEAGPEDDTLKDEYQILLAETDVLQAIRDGSCGPVPARVEKRTVRLTPLGLALWAASMGPEA